jgi:hypothetical protein
MATTCGMLQAVSQTLDYTSPGEVLEQVNETLLARIPPTCSPPASTPSSTPTALACDTLTQATICLTCRMVAIARS